MKNLTITKSRLLSISVALAAIAAANVLLLQTERQVRNATGAEVENATAEVPAAPAPITGVEAPKLSHEVLATEREFYVPVMRREISLPDPPAILVGKVRAQARSWLGDGVMMAPIDEILVDEPEVSQFRRIEEVELKVPQLERPELPSPPSVRR